MAWVVISLVFHTGHDRHGGFAVRVSSATCTLSKQEIRTDFITYHKKSMLAKLAKRPGSSTVQKTYNPSNTGMKRNKMAHGV